MIGSKCVTVLFMGICPCTDTSCSIGLFHLALVSHCNYEIIHLLIKRVGAIIAAIVGAIEKDQSAINDLTREISALNLAHAQVTAALSFSTPCLALTTQLSDGWSTLTTQTQNLQTFDQILENNPTRDANLRPIVQQSWKTLSNELARW